MADSVTTAQVLIQPQGDRRAETIIEIGDRAWIGPPKIEDAGVGVGESHHLAARPVRVGQHVDHPAVKFGELVAEDSRREPRQPIAHPSIGQRQPDPVHQFGIIDDTLGIEHVEVLVEEVGQRNPLRTLRSASGRRQVFGIEPELSCPGQCGPHLTSEPAGAQCGGQLGRPVAGTPAGQQFANAELLLGCTE